MRRPAGGCGASAAGALALACALAAGCVGGGGSGAGGALPFGGADGLAAGDTGLGAVDSLDADGDAQLGPDTAAEDGDALDAASPDAEGEVSGTSDDADGEVSGTSDDAEDEVSGTSDDADGDVPEGEPSDTSGDAASATDGDDGDAAADAVDDSIDEASGTADAAELPEGIDAGDDGDALTDVSADASADASGTLQDSDSSGDIDDAAAPWPPSAQAGSSCKGQDGAKACSTDGKLRLECVLGAWTPLSHCGFGVCQATKMPSGPPLLGCATPPTAHLTLAAACSRLTPCVAPGLPLAACMRAALSPGVISAEAALGGLVDPAQVAMAALSSIADCAAKAAGCKELALCAADLDCPGGAGEGCDGKKAWRCLGGKALVMDCSAHGVGCAVVAGAARCLLDAPCATGDVSACEAKVAKACVQTAAGPRAARFDCGAIGQTCKADVAAAAQPQAACGAVSPCPTLGVPACEAGKLATCTSGKLIEASCPSDAICLFEEDTGLLLPACPPFSTCPKAVCGLGGACSFADRCEGGEVFYCEQGQPRRFDCKTLGMSCVGGAAPRCG